MTDELKQWEYDRGYDKGKADVLDKIRAEIVELQKGYRELLEYDCIYDALRIIDKYKAESEDKHETDRKG